MSPFQHGPFPEDPAPRLLLWVSRPLLHVPEACQFIAIECDVKRYKINVIFPSPYTQVPSSGKRGSRHREQSRRESPVPNSPFEILRRCHVTCPHIILRHGHMNVGWTGQGGWAESGLELRLSWSCLPFPFDGNVEWSTSRPEGASLQWLAGG